MTLKDSTNPAAIRTLIISETVEHIGERKSTTLLLWHVEKLQQVRSRLEGRMGPLVVANNMHELQIGGSEQIVIHTLHV